MQLVVGFLGSPVVVVVRLEALVGSSEVWRKRGDYFSVPVSALVAEVAPDLLDLGSGDFGGAGATGDRFGRVVLLVVRTVAWRRVLAGAARLQ